MLLWKAEPPVQKTVSYVVQSRSVVPGFGGGGGGGGGLGPGGGGGAWMVLAMVGFSIFRAQAEERSVARRSLCNIVAIWVFQGLCIK